MRALILAILAAAAVSVPAPAAAQPEAPSAERIAAARTLLEVMDMRTLTEQSIETMLKVQLESAPQLRQFEGVMRTFFAKYLGWDAMSEAHARSYARVFTVQELNDLIAFYRTPTGQKLSRVSPELMREGAEEGQRVVQEHMGELQGMLAEAMAGQPAPSPKP
jgi:uncharacterized protein